MNELYHHGINGMKWGVRRYQNKDGSLTRAGKKRQQQEEEMSDDAKYANELKKKKVNQLTNAELKKLNERQEMEKKHSTFNKSTLAKGMATVGTIIAVANLAINLSNTGKKVGAEAKPVVDKAMDKVGDWAMKDLNKGLSKGFN